METCATRQFGCVRDIDVPEAPAVPGTLYWLCRRRSWIEAIDDPRLSLKVMLPVPCSVKLLAEGN
jgi:hypothetical protein